MGGKGETRGHKKQERATEIFLMDSCSIDSFVSFFFLSFYRLVCGHREYRYGDRGLSA
jgi:hypothetical protein